MKYVIATSDKVDGERWQIHRDGCKHRRGLIDAYSVDAASTEELIARELANELRADGWTEADFKVMPCIKRS